VFQQLLLKDDISINYYPFDNGRYKLDFIIDNEDGDLIPIEVKAGENLSASSFKIYCERHNPQTAIKTSLTNYKPESWMLNLPLYVINTL
jgi:predicted AAA+ superfamily ATPase